MKEKSKSVSDVEKATGAERVSGAVMAGYATSRCNTRVRHKHKRSADRRKHDSSSVAQRISLQTTGYAGRTCDNKPGKKCDTEKKSAGGGGGKRSRVQEDQKQDRADL